MGQGANGYLRLLIAEELASEHFVDTSEFAARLAEQFPELDRRQLIDAIVTEVIRLNGNAKIGFPLSEKLIS
jgi:hypothetical protein